MLVLPLCCFSGDCSPVHLKATTCRKGRNPANTQSSKLLLGKDICSAKYLYMKPFSNINNQLNWNISKVFKKIFNLTVFHSLQARLPHLQHFHWVTILFSHHIYIISYILSFVINTSHMQSCRYCRTFDQTHSNQVRITKSTLWNPPKEIWNLDRI